MKKDVKILYNNDWIGLVVHTKSKIHFKVDKDEKIGWLDDEGLLIMVKFKIFYFDVLIMFYCMQKCIMHRL